MVASSMNSYLILVQVAAMYECSNCTSSKQARRQQATGAAKVLSSNGEWAGLSKAICDGTKEYSRKPATLALALLNSNKKDSS